MSVWVAIVLGLIQGLTEFLPVSSSGHLTFFELAFGFSSGSVLYNILLHFATLIALIIVMRKQIWQIISHPLDKYMRMLLLSSVITSVLAVIIDHFVGAEGNLVIIAIGFFATALLLVALNIFIKSKKYNPLAPVGYKQAIMVGIMQGVAVLPGLSRSGSTLCTGVFAGAGQKESAEFSFLLSIPIIIFGTVYEIYKGAKYGFEFSGADVLPMLIGCIVAFVSALLTLKLMLKLVSKNKWLWFATYLAIFATIILVFALK